MPLHETNDVSPPQGPVIAVTDPDGVTHQMAYPNARDLVRYAGWTWDGNAAHTAAHNHAVDRAVRSGLRRAHVNGDPLGESDRARTLEENRAKLARAS